MRLYEEGETVRYIGSNWYKTGEILRVIKDRGNRAMSISTETLDGKRSMHVDRDEIEPYSLASDILKGMSGTMSRRRLETLIDEALDSGDRDKFIEYSGMLKEMLVHA